MELTTMCAIVRENEVLMINRKKAWKGWAFPGGHIEADEGMTSCVMREIMEETGLAIAKVSYKGMAHFFNTATGERHIVSNYLCTDYKGTLVDRCDEGELRWIRIDEINDLSLAEGMEYRLPLFFEDGIKELFVEWNEVDGYTRVEYLNI